jgi:hypothetical protein
MIYNNGNTTTLNCATVKPFIINMVFRDLVREVWVRTSEGKKQKAVKGLYLALWSISTSALVPVLAADAYSSEEGEFGVPANAIPVLTDILQERAASGLQCCVTLPAK